MERPDPKRNADQLQKKKNNGYLPNKKCTASTRRLIDDAVSKGAKIVNKKGGEII
jgi:hypothetical protein